MNQYARVPVRPLWLRRIALVALAPLALVLAPPAMLAIALAAVLLEWAKAMATFPRDVVCAVAENWRARNGEP